MPATNPGDGGGRRSHRRRRSHRITPGIETGVPDGGGARVIRLAARLLDLPIWLSVVVVAVPLSTIGRLSTTTIVALKF
jgi:hypothetical protein